MLFPFSSHCDVIVSDKLRCRFININDELVWNVLLKDFIGNFVKELWSHFSPKRPDNYWPWYSDCTTWKYHPLVQWSNPWSCHFKIHILAESFWVHANQATPETTWMLIPAPAVRIFTRAKCNLRLSASPISNDRPLTFPIVDCTLVSPFIFFCSCMEFLWLFTHGLTVFSIRFGNFGWNFLIVAVTPQIVGFFAISCVFFSFPPERLLNFLEPFSVRLL